MKSSTSNNTRSWLLLIFSLVSILFLLGRGIFVCVSGLVALLGEQLTLAELAPAGVDALSMLLCAGLLVPLVVACGRALRGHEIPSGGLPPMRGRFVILLALAWVVILVVSSILTAAFPLGWLAAAPAFLLGMLIPVAGLAWLGAGGLRVGSNRRYWAAFSLGMTGATSLSLVLEYILVGVGIVIGVVVVASRPELLAELRALQGVLENTSNMQDMMLELAPLLTQPWVLVVGLLFVGVFGPLIEEAAKPLAVWLLGRRLKSTAEGFALGALSGAGFALLEGLLSASGMAATPYFGLPARLASSLLHISLSALMGWGIAGAYLHKRWLRLGGVYLLVVALHGIWNGSALVAVYGSLRTSLSGMTPDVPSMAMMAGGVLMLGLAFLVVAVSLPVLNRRLRLAQDDILAQDVIIAPLVDQTERTNDGLGTHDI